MALSKPGIDYTFNVVSLEHMTIVKVVASLLSQYFNILSIHQINNIYEKLPDAEKEIVKHALLLQLPHGLKGKVIGFIRPMFLEIFKWEKYFVIYLYINFTEKFLSMLCWTPQGTIDGQKTIRGLIENGNLDICQSFNLACEFCLEEEISEIFKQIPENQKVSYRDFYRLLGYNRGYLMKFWYFKLKGQSDIFPTIFNHTTFASSIEFSIFKVILDNLPNIGATRYFLPKLTIEERKRSLVICAKDLVSQPCKISMIDYYITEHDIYNAWSSSDILCLLLSYMDKEQQTEVFRTPGALMFLLNWPYQNFFLLTANYVLPHLHEKDYYELLLTMCCKALNNYKDYNYQNLLKLFWEQSPNSLKICVRNNVKWLLLKLIALNDKENIALILKDATVEEKEKMISACYENNKFICGTLIKEDKWDILEILIKECISSKDSLIIFKENVKKRLACNNLKRKFDWFIANIEI